MNTPETFLLIDDSAHSPDGQIHHIGDRKPPPGIAAAARAGQTLAEFNGWDEAQVRLRSRKSINQKYAAKMFKWLFDFEVELPISEDDFVRLYTTPMRYPEREVASR